MRGLDFFFLRQGCDFLVVARLHLVIGDGLDHMLAEIGVMQLTVLDEFHALLEIFSLFQTFGAGVLYQKLDVDRAGKGCDLLLLVGKLRELRVEVAHGEVEFGLVDFQIADLGDNLVFLCESRKLEAERGHNHRSRNFIIAQHFEPFGDNAGSRHGFRL
ncbi:hypothetical protein D3C86_1408680 [compost metagenome]